MNLWDIIAKPFGLLLLWLNNLVGNYGVAIFLFALIVKIIMLPFQMKSKKSTMRMSALQPQIAELQKRHAGNPQKLQQETSKLYKEEHINPMSGCLWSLIPFPILLALYRAIRQPLTVMMGIPAELLKSSTEFINKLPETLQPLVDTLGTRTSGYNELELSRHISANFSDFSGMFDKLVNINYNFLGLDLGSKPAIKFWTNGWTWASIGLFLIPIVSALLSWLQSKVATAQNNTAKADDDKDHKKDTPADQQAAQMKTMNLMMPLMSLYIGFIMPAALGVYWIYGSVLGILQDLILNKVYGKQLAAESAERDARMRAREAEWERKRQETEQRKAEGKTQENANTSKKKQQARQKAELDELKAAAIRQERADKRAAMGLPPEEDDIPASQVGDRRYARGRAYVPDRFTNPENAEAATAAAAAESEGYMASEEADAVCTEAPEEVEPVEADAPAECDAVEPVDPEELSDPEEPEADAAFDEDAEEVPQDDDWEDTDRSDDKE